MSRLIKAGDPGALRPFPLPPPSPPPVDPERVALAQRCAALEAELASLKDRLRNDVQAARAAGAADAQSRFQDDAQARVDAVSRAAANACQALGDQFARLEPLAVAIATTAIARFIGPDADETAMMQRMIATRLADLGADTLVALTVSAADFDDDRARLALVAGVAPATVEFAEHLPAGQCRMALQLGSIALDLQQERVRLLALLDVPA
jgi:hypothetical protein